MTATPTPAAYPATDENGNPICAECGVPRYMHAWVTQPGGEWHGYAEAPALVKVPAYRVAAGDVIRHGGETLTVLANRASVPAPGSRLPGRYLVIDDSADGWGLALGPGTLVDVVEA